MYFEIWKFVLSSFECVIRNAEVDTCMVLKSQASSVAIQRAYEIVRVHYGAWRVWVSKVFCKPSANSQKDSVIALTISDRNV